MLLSSVGQLTNCSGHTDVQVLLTAAMFGVKSQHSSGYERSVQRLSRCASPSEHALQGPRCTATHNTNTISRVTVQQRAMCARIILFCAATEQYELAALHTSVQQCGFSETFSNGNMQSSTLGHNAGNKVMHWAAPYVLCC